MDLQFVGMDDSVCKEGSVPCPDFCPQAIGMPHADDRPITMSGNHSCGFLLPFFTCKCKIAVCRFIVRRFLYVVEC